MTSGKKKVIEGLPYDQVVILLLGETEGVIEGSIKAFKNELDADEQFKLTKVQNELFYFFVYALDYWLQIDSLYTEEQKRIFEKIFSTHLDIMCGDDVQGRAMWETLRERFIAYDEIVNEKKSDSAKLLGFGIKVSEYCEIHDAVLVILVPELFKIASESVSVFRA